MVNSAFTSIVEASDLHASRLHGHYPAPRSIRQLIDTGWINASPQYCKHLRGNDDILLRQEVLDSALHEFADLFETCGYSSCVKR
jgi:hypothetical protein